jgi:6-phosphogluconolactonase
MPLRHDFATKEDLAKALALRVAGDIKADLEANGAAAIAVSGGSTPGKFFGTLGKTKDIDWSKVIVTLVDERWVPDTSDRSNAQLVNERMLQGPAATARFLPLYSGGAAPDGAAVARTKETLQALPERLSAVVLGMGNDGHTASFFPGGDTLDAALHGAEPVLAIRAPGAGEPRITLSLNRLVKTRGLYLHIEGEEKAGTLSKALGDGAVEDMPIRAVLRGEQPVEIFWCP